MKMLKTAMMVSILLLSTNSFAEVSVIVNSTNSSAIDKSLIKKIYLGKAKSFPSGNKAEVYSLSDDAESTEAFRQKALKKSNSQFKSYWSKLAFTGKGTPPKSFSSDQEMINSVKNNANAIGFVDSKNVTGDVKVVAKY